MSSCLILQAKDKLYIGADTSSSVFIDDKLYRLNNNTKKLFLLNDNTVLYCAGNNLIAEKVVQYISSIYHRNDFSLISLKNWLIEMYPYKNKDKTVYDVEILIATFKNNRTIVYQMSQYKNYDIISFDICDTGVQILSAGIKNAECMSFAENELLNKSGVKTIFRTTFNNLSCNYIGGCLDLYEITKNGAVKIFDSERINEHGIQYAHDVFNDLSVSLNAEVLVSKLVMSENLWIENNSGNYKFDDNGFTATSGKNTIKIQPNNSGELFSIYKGSNKQVYINSSGDVEFAGTLKSASGQFSGLLSGGSINLGNGVFTVDENGNMNASSARISGEVNASSGTIGGWNINSNSLSSSNNSVFLSSDGTISGATITGANGNFTEGFSVSCPIDDFYLSSDLIIKGDSSGIKFGYNNMYGFYGMELFKSGINLSTSGGKNFSLDQVTINGSSLRNLITQNILSDYVVSSQNVSAKYTQATGSYGTGGDLIMFDNASSGKKTGATAGYVQTYVRDYVGAKLPHEYVSGITSDSWSTVESNTWVITSVSISETSYTSSSDSIASTRSRLFLSGSKIKKNLSDKRLKENIKDLDDKFIQLYDKLNPKQFSFHDDIPTTKGKHFGLIAQDVMSAIDECGIDNSNLRLVWRNKVDEEANEDKYINDYTLQMDYDELHALHIKYSQHLNDKIDMLEKRVAELEKTIRKE